MKNDFKNGTIYFGDVLECAKKIESNSVDCVITSPPYWQLRDYGFAGQWGLEPTYKEYLAHLQELMTELWRIVKPQGTVWVNLGDSYNSGGNDGSWRNGDGSSTINKPNRGLAKANKYIQSAPWNKIIS